MEASRAPYSKSHARRLKRREKEQLTAGGLGSLKAALPSIAPTASTARTRTTAATAIIGDRPAGKLDAAAATTAAAAIDDVSMKPTIDIDKLKSKQQQQQPTDRLDAPPTTARPGQIGEGHGAPLVVSQRRRALYGTIIANCHFAFVAHLFQKKPLLPCLQGGRTFPSTPDTFEPRVRCKSIRNNPNACTEYPRPAQANIVLSESESAAVDSIIIFHPRSPLCWQFHSYRLYKLNKRRFTLARRRRRSGTS